MSGDIINRVSVSRLGRLIYFLKNIISLSVGTYLFFSIRDCLLRVDLSFASYFAFGYEEQVGEVWYQVGPVAFVSVLCTLKQKNKDI